jgi:hypothetical protein
MAQISPSRAEHPCVTLPGNSILLHRGVSQRREAFRNYLPSGSLGTLLVLKPSLCRSCLSMLSSS